MRSLEVSALFSIEPMMYFGIGFLVASLIALALFPIVHNRAVRLNTREVMSAMPYSLTEISAEKDGLRAMFAVEIRKLEIRIEELVSRLAAQAAQLGRQQAANKRLKQELEKETALVAAMKAREDPLMSRQNALMEELVALRDENRKNRETGLPMRLPPAHSPWGRQSGPSA